MKKKDDAKVVSLERKRVDVAIADLDALKADRRRGYDRIMSHVEQFLGEATSEFSEADKGAAAKVVAGVLGWFVAPIPAELTMNRLARLATLVDTSSMRFARVAAVHKIAVIAQFRSDPEAVAWLAAQLARNKGLGGVLQDIEGLAGRLADVEAGGARGKKGKIGPERLLAELIYDEQDALGFTIDPSEDRESEIERVRKLLARDVKDHREK